VQIGKYLTANCFITFLVNTKDSEISPQEIPKFTINSKRTPFILIKGVPLPTVLHIFYEKAFIRFYQKRYPSAKVNW